jgi:hypothetical protein
MSKAEILGLCKCPECGHPDAVIKNDKGGNPYRFCEECTAQYFTRGKPHKVRNLLKQIREPDKPAAPAAALPVAPSKVTEDATDRTAVKAPAAIPAAIVAPTPAKPQTSVAKAPARSFSLEDL